MQVDAKSRGREVTFHLRPIRKGKRSRSELRSITKLAGYSDCWDSIQQNYCEWRLLYRVSWYL